MKIPNKYLVSLNTAKKKIKKNHPRIANDLDGLLELLKLMQENLPDIGYKGDGFIDIDH